MTSIVPSGVSPGADFMQLSDADLTKEVALYASSGATWIRLDFAWASIERSKGVYTWDNMDRVTSACQSAGLKILGILAYTPGHVASSDDNISVINAYGDFVTAVVGRYAPRKIRHWEIWNEPNNPGFFDAPSVEAYARLLSAAYHAARSKDPGASVVAGALSPAVTANGWIEPVEFIQKLYLLGGKHHFTALSLHPYSFPASPLSTESWSTFQKISTVRSMMNSFGDTYKMLWLSEWGVPTGGTNSVTEAVQAQHYAEAFQRARTMTSIGPLLVYSGRDRGTDPNNFDHHFGMVRRDWTPKPSLAAFRTASGK